MTGTNPKSEKRFLPFFLNKTRLARDESYFNGNYRLEDLMKWDLVDDGEKVLSNDDLCGIARYISLENEDGEGSGELDKGHLEQGMGYGVIWPTLRRMCTSLRQHWWKREVPKDIEAVDVSVSHENLFVGPPLLDFNEPLQLSPPRDQENRPPIPINSGDLRAPPNEGEMARAHAVNSDPSLEDLQRVVSAFGLEAPKTKPSCHMINHMNNGQSACCRHDNHNITWESLDLEIAYGRLGHGHPNYCCCHPSNRIKRGLVRRPCPMEQH